MSAYSPYSPNATESSVLFTAYAALRSVLGLFKANPGKFEADLEEEVRGAADAVATELARCRTLSAARETKGYAEQLEGRAKLPGSPAKAGSKSEYRRMIAQGADVAAPSEKDEGATVHTHEQMFGAASSDTPRTDEIEARVEGEPNAFALMTDHARQLERELAEANRLLLDRATFEDITPTLSDAEKVWRCRNCGSEVDAAGKNTLSAIMPVDPTEEIIDAMLEGYTSWGVQQSSGIKINQGDNMANVYRTLRAFLTNPSSTTVPKE